MKIFRLIRALYTGPIFVCIVLMGVPAQADVIEIGDLNVIDDPGNPSDGLRYLDMIYGDGLTLAAALTNAQATYSNARLATPAEWDDLFAAAGITYNGATTASDAFTVGASGVLSSGVSYDGGTLLSQIGFTVGTSSFIWSDPDGSTSIVTTRDYINMTSAAAGLSHATVLPPHANVGWLLVSEATTTVSIDIKPGSDPNAVNPKSKGVIPVAVLGTEDFDVTQIDPSTVVLGGASSVNDGHVEDINDDGFIDFVFHFKITLTGIACGDIEATLTGQTFGGEDITGTDSVKTAGCK